MEEYQKFNLTTDTERMDWIEENMVFWPLKLDIRGWTIQGMDGVYPSARHAITRAIFIAKDWPEKKQKNG